MGWWNGVEKHGCEGDGKVAGLNSDGRQGAGDPGEGCRGGDSIAKLLVVRVIVGVEVEGLAESTGSGE